MNFQMLEKLTEDLSDHQLDEVIRLLNNSDSSKENRFDRLHIIYRFKENEINKAINELKSKLYAKLDGLSERQLHELADVMGIGFVNEPEDKEEVVMVLSMEKLRRIEEGLKKLKNLKKLTLPSYVLISQDCYNCPDNCE
ncbi:MAG: hypothetical protein ABH864_04120 [archaeon]